MTDIKRVHVIFKTHLDMGFTDLAKHVIDRYMKQFIPQALELSERLAEEDGKANFVWTTGSWLIHEYLRTASPDSRSRMEEAIRQGRIAWHGLPFTTHSELMDARLFEFGLSLSRNLDRQFGKKTIAAKMTDVPGHTIGIVPILARNGIQYLHLGVNPASTKPNVPEVFVWRAADGSEIIVNYAADYGKPLKIEGLEDALYFAHTGDNHGPSGIEAVRDLFDRLQLDYPGAEIVASSLDAFAAKLFALKDRLPVIREEIGDSWIHGVGSDPWMVARYRELLRLRDEWTSSGALHPDSEQYKLFCNRLMLIPEHTWGLDEKVYLGDYSAYASGDFAAARENDRVNDAIINKFSYLQRIAKPDRTFLFFESSWKEQRGYIDQALSALPQELASEALAAFERMVPDDAIDTAQEAVQLDWNTRYELGWFQASFSPDGSIQQLVDSNGKVWANASHRLGVYRYETFGKENYDRFFNEYVTDLRLHHGWADADFGKPGMEYAMPRPEQARYSVTGRTLQLEKRKERDVVRIELTVDSEAVERYGAPRKLIIMYAFHKREPLIDVELHWTGKSACRLPEASWISFMPLVDNPNMWRMDKLGELISPLTVVKDGNRSMHAVNSGLYYEGADGSCAIRTLDAPLVCPGEGRLLQFDNTFASLDGGFHFNLHNNVWGTNFRMWFEDDMKYRFQLTLRSFDRQQG
ncbi:DUF5054 domain-containing protein [Paenibacillus spongiae]|uniref:DUF5054 domain-containing protein n=1 Tax=Paenibacillus spongiae TaxID=2909671 RepID=A0ABY5S7Y7_9BACL|nr:DUF5054 domain-containing protein [Paenibacillus spongiae]UVI28818.1 DUF5054 domain-containing protein [Paenibacillus spongiae]